MSLTAIKGTINTLIRQKTADYSIPTSDVAGILDAIADSIQAAPAYATTIPFTSMVSVMAAQTISGATTFTPNTAGAIAGFGALLRLTADGTNTPAFSGFKKSNASKDWVATTGTTNIILFLYDGTDYWYSIYQQAGVGGAIPITPAAPTSAVVDDATDTFDWTHPSGYSTSDEETTVDGGTTWIAAVKPLSIGNVAKAIGQVGVRVKAIGINNPSAGLFNATAFTMVSDTTPPTIVSAGTQNTNIVALYMSENMSATSTAGHTVTIDGSSVSISSATISANTQIILQLAVTILAGQVIRYSYNPSTGNTLDSAGNELAAVNNLSVTNNVSSSNRLTVDGNALTVGGNYLVIN